MDEKVNGNKLKILLILAAVAIVCIIAVCFLLFHGEGKKNKYNDMGYVNISGKTVGEVASEAGMSFEDFLKEYELPEDMPPDTDEAAAYYMMPVYRVAEMANSDFETYRRVFKFDEDVMPETPFGEAMDNITLADMVGEDNVDVYINKYDLGNGVTGSTKWGDVRRKIDKIKYKN